MGSMENFEHREHKSDRLILVSLKDQKGKAIKGLNLNFRFAIEKDAKGYFEFTENSNVLSRVHEHFVRLGIKNGDKLVSVEYKSGLGSTRKHWQRERKQLLCTGTDWMKKLEKVRGRVEAMTFQTQRGEFKLNEKYTVTYTKDQDDTLMASLFEHGNRVQAFSKKASDKAQRKIELNDVIIKMTCTGNPPFYPYYAEGSMVCREQLIAWKKKWETGDKIEIVFARPEPIAFLAVRRRLSPLERLVQEIQEVEC